MSESIVKKMKLKMTKPSEFPISTEIVTKKSRDTTNYIAAAKKNKWIKHVKKCSKEHKVDYKTAMAIATRKYKKQKSC